MFPGILDSCCDRVHLSQEVSAALSLLTVRKLTDLVGKMFDPLLLEIKT